MIHLLLFLTCIFAIEAFYYLKFLNLLKELVKIANKLFYVIPNIKISDHWKEIVVPKYSLILMRLSLNILFILVCIFLIFYAASLFDHTILEYSLSIQGIAESLLFISFYIYLKKYLSNE